jgi:hypothetical protein
MKTGDASVCYLRQASPGLELMTFHPEYQIEDFGALLSSMVFGIV